MLLVLAVLSCTACFGQDTLLDNIKGGTEQLGNDVAIKKSNTFITPCQSSDGNYISDNIAFQAIYDVSVTGFKDQDILVAANLFTFLRI